MNADMAQLASLAHGQMSQDLAQESHDDNASVGTKRKSDDGQQGSSKTRRSRYISLACNECKRRKIKCNGQTPCQRCGNLNLECVYAPNCCNSFKDTQDYKDMAAHIGSLQEQVNMLYDNLNNLRAQLGQGPSPMSQHQSQPDPIQQQPPPIDPSLQSQGYGSQHGSFSGVQSSSGAPIASMSPSSIQPKSQAALHGPTGFDYNVGVAKNSAQVIGAHPQADGAVDNGTVEASADSMQQSPIRSPGRFQASKWATEEKDPIWSITREEALRLCRVYEDEMGIVYPVVDISKVTAYANKLYVFLEAMHRSGLMQPGLSGPDSVEDEDTNVLKLVMATALTIEGSGRSELGKRIFEYVQPAVNNLFVGNLGVKSIQLKVLTAMYELNRDNESVAWRIVGLAARLCIDLGLHRLETYEAIGEMSERSEANLLFWTIYILERHGNPGTGMPFRLQDAEIDPFLPRPGDRSPYLTAMLDYCGIGSKVWRSVGASLAPFNPASIVFDAEELDHLDHEVIQWHRGVQPSLRFEHQSQPGRVSTLVGPPLSRAVHRLRIVLYLRANQMRIFLYRMVLHSAASTGQHSDQAHTVVSVAKDTIRVLAHVDQTTDLYRTQQVLFNPFLLSALAVLLLTVSHEGSSFADGVREEFYMAVDLVRRFSKDSSVSKRLWRTIRGLKEFAPKLGLSAIEGKAHAAKGKDDVDPSRSAAVAMAGLAGHNVDEMALFSGGGAPATWSEQSDSSSSPQHMANDLTNLFKAAGNLQAMGQSVQNGNVATMSAQYSSTDSAGPVQSNDADGTFAEDEVLWHVLKDLF